MTTNGLTSTDFAVLKDLRTKATRQQIGLIIEYFTDELERRHKSANIELIERGWTK